MVFQTLFSGSSGNSAYISDGKTHLLVDAGMGIRAMEQAFISCDIRPQGLSAILITHEHIDHIRGCDALSAKYDIPLYATYGTWMAMEHTHIKRTLLKNRVAFDRDADFYVGDFNIQPFAIPHDAQEPCGYCIVNRNKKAVIATDMGHTTNEFIGRAQDADLILLESNYDLDMLRTCAYPQMLKRRIVGRKGHLSNHECAQTLCRMIGYGKVRSVVLGHLSKNSNTPELALAATQGALIEQGVRIGKDLELGVASRDSAGIPIVL